jgi:Family of unknown function (DUF5343)
MAPPFLNATGLVTKILDKIIEASQPERFTQDFLATKLGFSGGSARPMISLLKKLGFIASDGTPTPLYGQFRNPENRGAAMAQALRSAYKEIYDRNEYAHDLPREKFKNLVVEITGLEPDNQMVSAMRPLMVKAALDIGATWSERRCRRAVGNAAIDAWKGL